TCHISIPALLLFPARLCRQTRPPPSPPLFPYTTLFRSMSSAAWGRRPTSSSSTSGRSSRGSWRWRHRLRIQRTPALPQATMAKRSEEHTSELQSRFDLVCRLLLEKKKDTHTHARTIITH